MPEMEFQEVLARAHEVATEYLAPRANSADQADRLPLENLHRLAEAGLLGLTTPAAYCGHGAPPEVVRAFMEIMARACGVTIFVAFQHVVACRHVAACENDALKAELLPRLATGQSIATLAFSHLRRPGPPTLRAERDGEGFRLNGTAPWATGWGLAEEILVAGTLPDGHSAWVVAPLVESEMLQASPPMRLCAMNASATVSLTCRDLRVGPERFVKTMTPEELRADTSTAILFFSSLSLGAAMAAIDLIRARAAARPGAILTQTAEALEQETKEARGAVEAAAKEVGTAGYPAAALEARAWCVELGVRAAHAAVTANSGAANLLENSAQRIFREAMVYTSTAQTSDLQSAVLERLVRL